MNELMVDIESLDTKPGCPVLSIGWNVFKGSEIIDTDHVFLNLKEQLNKKVNANTLSWWMRQSEAARTLFTACSTSTVSEVGALIKLGEAYRQHNCEAIWANGITFDIGVLEEMYRKNTLEMPWQYNSARDLRTMHNEIGKECGIEWPDPSVAHDAVSDALAQTQYLINIRKHLRRKL